MVPAMVVKSSAPSITGEPSIDPEPTTIPSTAISPPTSVPNSRKVPGSSSRSIRARVELALAAVSAEPFRPAHGPSAPAATFEVLERRRPTLGFCHPYVRPHVAAVTLSVEQGRLLTYNR